MTKKTKVTLVSLVLAIGIIALQFWGAAKLSNTILWQFYIVRFLPGLFYGHIGPGETFNLGFRLTAGYALQISIVALSCPIYAFVFAKLITRPRSVFKGFLYIIGGLFVLPIALYLVLLYINWKDDDLRPDVEKLLKEQPAQIAAKDNGYFAYIGLMGPSDQSPHAWGYRWFQAVTDREKNLKIGDSFGPHPYEDEIRKEAMTIGSSLCSDVTTCLESVAAAPEEARKLLDEHKITLERADQVLAYPAFQEAWRPDLGGEWPLPPSGFKPWFQLVSISFALDVAEGRDNQALQQLSRVYGFAVKFLEGSYSLANKMVGLGLLKRNYSLLNQYMRLKPVVARQRLEVINTMLVPLEKAVVSLKPALLGEQRHSARIELALKDLVFLKKESIPFYPAWWLFDQMYRAISLPKASANELADLFSPLIQAENSKGNDYRKALKEYQFIERNKKGPVFAWLKWRNPIGQILNAIALTGSGYTSYFVRRDDLLALRQLVAFQAALLRRAKADGERIATILETVGTELEHPYFGTEARWNKQERSLFFPVGEKLPSDQEKHHVTIKWKEQEMIIPSDLKLATQDAKPVSIRL